MKNVTPRPQRRRKMSFWKAQHYGEIFSKAVMFVECVVAAMVEDDGECALVHPVT